VLYGRVLIEYERPGTFEHPSGFNHAKEQVVGYIKQLTPSVEEYQKYFGVVYRWYEDRFCQVQEDLAV